MPTVANEETTTVVLPFRLTDFNAIKWVALRITIQHVACFTPTFPPNPKLHCNSGRKTLHGRDQ